MSVKRLDARDIKVITEFKDFARPRTVKADKKEVKEFKIKQLEAGITATKTDLLQNREGIKNKLKNYIETEISKIPLNSHVRYISWDPNRGCQRFRLGGFLKIKNNKYIILSNGKLSWSVSLEYIMDRSTGTTFKTRFFKRVTKTDMDMLRRDRIIRKLHEKLGKLSRT